MIKNSVRLFFAISFNSTLCNDLEKLIKKLHKQTWNSKIRWVPIENLHITLRFIGNCSIDHIETLIEHAEKSIETISEFSMEAHDIKLFPSSDKPHMLALMIKPLAELFKLFETLEQGIVNAGFTPEKRAFLPHITLGRFTTPVHFSNEDLSNLSEKYLIPVHHIALMRSDEVNNKRIYTIIKNISLRKIHG